MTANLPNKEEKPDLVKLFTNAFNEVGGNAELIGNAILVGALAKDDIKKIGSLYIQKQEKFQVNAWDSNQPEFVKVLAVGKGYYDSETNKDIPCELVPGNIIQVGKASVNWFTTFGEIVRNAEIGFGVGLTLEGETKMKFKDEETYHKFMKHFDVVSVKVGVM